MATNFTNQEPLDLKSRSLYARLKRLFSTDVIVRNVGGKLLKIKDTDQAQYATDRNTLRDRFNRVRTSGYSQYSRDFTLAYQASRIELFRDYDCIGPDTVIPLPDGTKPTIKMLSEKYKDKPKERFYVFSYDHATDSIKLGQAFHPRLKGPREGFKVTFDNGKHIIGSEKHPFLMRDGEYKRIRELRVGDSVMPFYQKEYNHGYRRLYNFSRGWQSEHTVVAEQFNERPVNKNECVHHKGFNPWNNLPENLQIMTKREHTDYHANHNKNVLWSPENKPKMLEKMFNSPGYKNRKVHKWNGERAGKNNTFFGLEHSLESNQKRSDTLKEVFKDRNQHNVNNPNFRDDLTIDVLEIKAVEYYKEKEKLDIFGLCDFVGCDYTLIQNRLKSNNTNWFTFKNKIKNTLNHKIVSIESVGMLDVYDVTVDLYHNFATDSCYVANTMDMDPIIASALDIYSDECLKENEFGQILTVKSTNDNIKKILHNLFYDILNIEFNLWSWTRNMCKYGDFYLKLYISPEYGIFLVEPLSSYNVTRVENSNPENKNYIKYQISFESGVMEELENYQIAHFRLISDSNFLPYGKSMVEGARRVWKQLSLMEDAMLIHRIMRAPEKRVFKVDVGNIPPNEVDQYMDRLINKMKKIPYIDEKTGDYNLRFNLQNMVEDFYIPVRGGDSGTAIEPLSGMEFTGIDDIEYLRNKMMAALKIPKAFLSYEEDLSGKATLAAEDVRFAGTISRIQKILISELSKIAIVHLYSQGYTDAELVDFSLEFANPSIILEKEKVAILTDKVSVAKDIRENKLFSTEWIYKNLFKFSDDDILKIKNALVNDAKQEWRLKSISEEGTDPAVEFEKMNTSGGGGAPPPEGGAGEGFPGEPGGPPEPGGAPGGEAPPGAQKVGGGPETPEAGAGKELPPLTEKSIRPSQEGEKNAKDYPFGEDPLGSLENNADYRKNPLQYKYKKNSPLGFESVNVDPRKLLPHVNLKSLAMFLKNDEKRELLQENKDNGSKSKSMLDETNIRGE